MNKKSRKPSQTVSFNYGDYMIPNGRQVINCYSTPTADSNEAIKLVNRY